MLVRDLNCSNIRPAFNASGLFRLDALKDEATVSEVACRRAPVAIGKLILPELCVGAPNQETTAQGWRKTECSIYCDY
jgi:hypothetical protein